MTTEYFEVANDVAWLAGMAGDSDTIYATCLPDGPPVVLPATGGLIFVAATPGGTLDEIVERVSVTADAEPGAIRGDVVAFVEQLVRLGLLTRG